uniref:Putative short d7 salivary protein d7s5 n=1 Tax=Aedes albopictus TaxID=7160 RepID=A0A1W7R7Q4_AEDAL
MWVSLALVVASFLAAIAAEDVYTSCAGNTIESGDQWEHHILCKVGTFNMQDHDSQSLMDGTIKFMNCVFTKMAWMDENSKELKVSKIINDLNLGTDEKKEQQIENCKSSDPEQQNGMKYLECLQRRPDKSDTGVLRFIKNRESVFFNKFYCQGVTF